MYDKLKLRLVAQSHHIQLLPLCAANKYEIDFLTQIYGGGSGGQ